MECLMRRGSTRSVTLQNISSTILTKALSTDLQILAQHIAGATNVTADLISRTRTVAMEWTDRAQEFKRLERWHGKQLQVDLFSTPENAELKSFVTPYDHPNAVAVDALTLDWAQWQQVYLFSPPRLLHKVLPLLLASKTHGLILAPRHPQAPWFGSLLSLALKSTPVKGGLRQIVQGVEHSDFPLSYSDLTTFSFKFLFGFSL